MFLVLFLPVFGASADVFVPINTDIPRNRLELVIDVPAEAACRARCSNNSSCLAIVYSTERKRCALMGETIADKCSANYTAILRIPEVLTANLTWHYNTVNEQSMYCAEDVCRGSAATNQYGEPDFSHPTLMGTILKPGTDVMEKIRQICPEQSDSIVVLNHYFDEGSKRYVPVLNETAAAITGIASASEGACGASVSINLYKSTSAKGDRWILSPTQPIDMLLVTQSVY